MHYFQQLEGETPLGVFFKILDMLGGTPGSLVCTWGGSGRFEVSRGRQGVSGFLMASVESPTAAGILPGRIGGGRWRGKGRFLPRSLAVRSAIPR